MPPDFNKFRRSLRYAWKGFREAFNENNFRIHLIAAVLVCAAGFYFSITRMEWCIIILCIGVVLSAELFNSAIEQLCDHLHPAQHKSIGKVKDIAAAAVLVISLAALVVGVVIFNGYVFP